MISYSASTRGFYSTVVHGNDIPSDAVEITEQEHAALLAGVSAGKVITVDADGHPVLADQPAPSQEVVVELERTWRDARIAETDYLAMPDYPLTDAQRGELYAYRQALRDWPSAGSFPTADNRPQPAIWLFAIDTEV